MSAYIITSSGVVTDTPEDPRYGADARWQVFGETFKATPREQLETHSETSLETVHGLRSGVLDTRTNE